MQLGKRYLEFLGHVVGEGMISVPAARVGVIADHPLPKTRKQLRAFLGMVGYYRRFIAGFHRWSALLTPHTSALSDGRVSWSGPMLEAFRSLCVELCNAVSLCVPNVCDKFLLESDASSTGVGAALSVIRDGEKLPVAFFSRQLRGAQIRYSAQELEGLAVYEAVRHFGYYLYGQSFVVVTDHKGLLNLKDGKQENRRVYGWALKLADYNFKMEYRSGRSNGVADELSRCFSNEGDEVTEGNKQSLKEGGDVG